MMKSPSWSFASRIGKNAVLPILWNAARFSIATHFERAIRRVQRVLHHADKPFCAYGLPLFVYKFAYALLTKHALRYCLYCTSRIHLSSAALTHKLHASQTWLLSYTTVAFV